MLGFLCLLQRRSRHGQNDVERRRQREKGEWSGRKVDGVKNEGSRVSRPPCYCGQSRLLIRKEKKVPTRVSPSPDHANLPIVIRYQRTASERRIPRGIDRHLWELYLFEPRRCKCPRRSRYLILDSGVSIVGLIEGYTASCHYGSIRRFRRQQLLCPGRQLPSMSPTGSCSSCIGVYQGRLGP